MTKSEILLQKLSQATQPIKPMPQPTKSELLLAKLTPSPTPLKTTLPKMPTYSPQNTINNLGLDKIDTNIDKYKTNIINSSEIRSLTLDEKNRYTAEKSFKETGDKAQLFLYGITKAFGVEQGADIMEKLMTGEIKPKSETDIEDYFKGKLKKNAQWKMTPEDRGFITAGDFMGTIAALAVPYDIAGKTMAGMKAFQFITNKFVRQQVTSLIADTAIVTIPQMIKDIQAGEGAGEVLKGVGANTALNIVANLTFGGLEILGKKIMQNRAVKKAIADYTAGKITIEEMESVVMPEAKLIIKDTPELQATQTITDNMNYKNMSVSHTVTGEMPKEKINWLETPDSIGELSNLQNRKFAQNMFLSETTPEIIQNNIKSDFRSFYNVYADKASLEEASNFINEHGEASFGIIKEILENGRPTKGTMITAAHLVGMIENEMPKEASDLLALMAIRGTEGGQMSQSFSLIYKMTDTGYAFQVSKQIKKLNAEMTAKFGDKFKPIEMDDTLKELLDLRKKAITNEEKELIGKQISEYIGSKIPSTKLDKFTSFRHLAMLAAPKTDIKNLGGNVIMALVKHPKNAIGELLEGLANIPKELKTKTILWKTRNPDIILTVKKAAAKIIDSAMTGQKMETGLNILPNQKVWTGGIEKPNAFLKGMQGFTDWRFNLLNKEDRLSFLPHLEDALGQIMTARGLTEVTDDVMNLAIQEAKKLTFRDDSKLVSNVLNFQKNHKVLGLVVDTVMPFKKTPVNIGKRVIEYSPLGLGNGIVDAIKNSKSPEMLVKSIDKIAAGVTGSVIWGIGILLARNGVITGAPDSNKDKANFDLAAGKQPFAFKIGDKYFTYDWALPIGAVLATGAATWDAIKGDKDLMSIFLDATAADIDSMFNSSVFKGMRDAFAGRYGENVSDALYGIATEFGKSFIPSGLATLGRIGDKNVRTTSYQSIPSKKLWDDIVNKAGFGKTLQPKISTRGETVKRVQNPILRALYETLSPAFISEYNPVKADSELQRLYKSTGDKTIFPRVTPKYFVSKGKTYTLTPEQATEFQTIQGQDTYERLDKLIKSDTYKRATDENKAKMIAKILDVSYGSAKANLLKKVNK